MTELKRRLQKTNKNQYLLTIPKTLVDILNWNDKDEICFKLEKGEIKICKKENILKKEAKSGK